MPQARRSSQLKKQVNYAGSNVTYFMRRYLDALSVPGSWKIILVLAIAAGVVTWKMGLAAGFRASEAHNLGDYVFSDLWFSPTGNLVAYRGDGSSIQVMAWDPASLRSTHNWQFEFPKL